MFFTRAVFNVGVFIKLPWELCLHIGPRFFVSATKTPHHFQSKENWGSKPQPLSLESKASSIRQRRLPMWRTTTVQSAPVHYYVQVLEKAHMRSTPSLESIPSVAFETVPMSVWLTTALSRPFKEQLALPFRGQELCDSGGGRPGLPSLTVPRVSVDGKQHEGKRIECRHI